MIQESTIVKNPTGLHARPAAQFVALCKGFQSKIEIESEGKKADAKSMFSVLRCCIKTGDTVTIRAKGADEVQAIQQAVAFLDSLEE